MMALLTRGHLLINKTRKMIGLARPRAEHFVATPTVGADLADQCLLSWKERKSDEEQGASASDLKRATVAPRRQNIIRWLGTIFVLGSYLKRVSAPTPWLPTASVLPRTGAVF